MSEIVPHNNTELDRRQEQNGYVPVALLQDAGERAQRSLLDFFEVELANENTQRAYSRAVRRFFAWCQSSDLDIQHVHPSDVARYFREVHPGAPASKRQERAAIRRLFDWLVKDQVIPFNPASSVRLKRYSVRTGKTPILDNADMKRLLESIETKTISGLRDRAIIGAMFYTFCRVGALVKIQTGDYYHHGRRSFLRLREKGGKEIEAPVHHALQGLLDAYLQAARLQMAFDAEDEAAPLFRSLSPKRTLTSKALDTSAVRYMVKRRIRKAGLYGKISPHSFRGTGITNYLEHGGQVEHAQHLAAHADPRTTKLYDRRQERVSLDEVERIRLD